MCPCHSFSARALAGWPNSSKRSPTLRLGFQKNAPAWRADRTGRLNQSRLARANRGRGDPGARPHRGVWGASGRRGRDADGTLRARALSCCMCRGARGRQRACRGLVGLCASLCGRTSFDAGRSDYERRTLRQLRHQTWLGTKRGVALAIEKPVFDLGPSGRP